MPRELYDGNGNLQVNFDNDLNIGDMYFPYVGMENHVSGHFCRLGVWVDGRFSWINGSWNKRFRHKEDSLVTDVSLKNPGLQIELQIQGGVHHFHDVFLRKVMIRNAAEKEREVRLFFHTTSTYPTPTKV